MNKKLLLPLLIISTSLLFLFLCREDELLIEDEDRTIDQFETFYETDLRGRVIDESGLAISGTLVSTMSKQTTIDQFGFFDLGSIDAPSSGLFIEVVAGGFHQSGTQFVPNSVDETFRLITLPEKQIERFNSNEGTSIITTHGSELTIPGDAIARNGQAYDGEVRKSTMK